MQCCSGRRRSPEIFHDLPGYNRVAPQGKGAHDRNRSISSGKFACFDLIHITPHPSFSGFDGANKRMLGSVKVLGGVFVLGRITAADVATGEAEPQMNPPVTSLDTVFANVCVCACYFDLFEVSTFLCH